MSNQETSEPPYSFKIKRRVLKTLRSLDKPVKERFYNKLMERCRNPHVPSAALHGDLAGCYKIRVGHWRLVYQVIDKELVLLVILLGERDNDDVYS